jgi:integrase
VWVGRWTEPALDLNQSRPKYICEGLGPADDRMSFADALKAAGKFFERCEHQWKVRAVGGAAPDVHTVEDACKAYIEKLRAEKGNGPAKDAEYKLKPVIYGRSFGRVRLQDELSAILTERWRNGLVTPRRERKSVNRIFRSWVAAMNWAKSRGYIDTDLAWRSVGEFPVEDGKREGYLTSVQRLALLAACDQEKTTDDLKADPALAYCTPDLGNLLRGYFYTGSRPGELVKLRVSALNTRDKTLTLMSAKNKKGQSRPRIFYLYEEAAYAFFAGMAKDKLPLAFLITKADGTPWVYRSGLPHYRKWAAGIKAAIRLANQGLNGSERISEDIVAYSIRHVVITDMLSEDNIDVAAVQKVTGTSAAMIEKNYYSVVEERLKRKLSERKSL